ADKNAIANDRSMVDKGLVGRRRGRIRQGTEHVPRKVNLVRGRNGAEVRQILQIRQARGPKDILGKQVQFAPQTVGTVSIRRDGQYPAVSGEVPEDVQDVADDQVIRGVQNHVLLQTGRRRLNGAVDQQDLHVIGDAVCVRKEIRGAP